MTVPDRERSSAVIECAHDAVVPLEQIIPNPRNPNRHSSAQVELLAKIIKAQGWRAPITVSERSGFIVKGHARLAAAQLLGLESAPVDYQQYANEAAEWADMIADNRIAELATRDMPALKDLLEELNTGAIDMDLTGYTHEALERVMVPSFSDVPLDGIKNYEGGVIIEFDRAVWAQNEAQIRAALQPWPCKVRGEKRA